jgi:hypothetical protein
MFKCRRARAAVRAAFAASVLWACGCATHSALLVHPESGATARCQAAASGILFGSAAALLDECVRAQERRGYKVVEKLTPAERAELERRGLLTAP